MSFFGRIEQFLEEMVEGLTRRGGDSLPAEILRSLAGEIRKNSIAKGCRIWAPSDCRILLTREAMRLILPIQTELEEELRSALTRFAEQAGLDYQAPLRFKFSAGDGSGVAVLSTRVLFAMGPPDEGTAADGAGDASATKVYRRAGGGKAAPAYAWLTVEAGPDLGREFVLSPSKTEIGRQDTNHIVLHDPNVSRRHAQVLCEHGVYRLIDLESTNRSFVNGRPAFRRRLRDGDRIRMGRTEMIFHSRRFPGR